MKLPLISFIVSLIMTITGAVMTLQLMAYSEIVFITGIAGFLLSSILLVVWLLNSHKSLKNGFYSSSAKSIKYP